MTSKVVCNADMCFRRKHVLDLFSPVSGSILCFEYLGIARVHR